MKWLPATLFFIIVFFFLGNYLPQEQKELEMLDDGCLVHALYFKQTILAQQMLGEQIWSRVLAIHFYGATGHAVTVFVYENNTFVYDPNRGSFVVAGYPLYDPLTIAEICFPKIPIKRAHYLEPTFLLHYQYRPYSMFE